MGNFQSLPKSVREAILTRNKPALRAMGRKGAATRAANLTKKREIAEDIEELEFAQLQADLAKLSHDTNEDICPID